MLAVIFLPFKATLDIPRATKPLTSGLVEWNVVIPSVGHQSFIYGVLAPSAGSLIFTSAENNPRKSAFPVGVIVYSNPALFHWARSPGVLMPQ